MSARAHQALDFIFAELTKDAPGATAAIVQGDRVLAERSIGLTHPGRKTPWSRNAKARIASLSKPMAAQVILALAAQGVLGLDARVGAYLPWLRPPQADVSLRHMLSMRAGLLEEFPLVYLAAGGGEDHHTLEQRLALIAAQRRLNFPPDTRTLYSNTGYTLLQRVAETVTGESFDALLRKYVFDPADMRDSAFVASEAWAHTDLGIGHTKRSDGLRPFDYFAEATAAGGVVSTLQDLLNWRAYLKHDYVWAVMSAPAFQRDGYVSGYGLGVELKMFAGLRTVGHAGGLRGWASDYVAIPDLDAAIIVLANRTDLNWYERSREALCIAFDLPADPSATPRLIAKEAPAPAWRANFVDEQAGHAVALAGSGAELNFEGRRLPRCADGVFRRSLGVEPISFEFGALPGEAPGSVTITEGDVVAVYERADPIAADPSEITGVYEAPDLPGRIAIAQIDDVLHVLVGSQWPQDDALVLKPITRSVWRAYDHVSGAPLDLCLSWPDLAHAPDIMQACMTRLLRYPYRRVGDAAKAEALFRWKPLKTRKSA